jgi:monomeric isocitrate dehydrogenase
MYDAKLNRLEIEVSAMKEKISFFNVIYQKFDDTLDKVQKLMEDRRNETNHDLKDVYSKISDVETKIMDEIHSMREDMKRQHEEERRKISELDKWRWMIMGASVVIGWLVSRITNLFP